MKKFNTTAVCIPAKYNKDVPADNSLVERLARIYKRKQKQATLTVTNRNSGELPDITITPVSDEVVYDGTEHTVTGFENQGEDGRILVEVDGETYYVSGYESSATGKDVNGDGIGTTVTGTPV